MELWHTNYREYTEKQNSKPLRAWSSMITDARAPTSGFRIHVTCIARFYELHHSDRNRNLPSSRTHESSHSKGQSSSTVQAG